MEKVVHRSESRGFTDQGWLKTHHTFSFGNYYDPRRIHFGALRVLNDNVVAGGEGFSSHPHDNMEIVSIPLRGELEHGDSMGNIQMVPYGDVQVMTAGTGIIHNEYNSSQTEDIEYLHIWIFPDEYELKPSYSHGLLEGDRTNKLRLIVQPYYEEEVPGAAKIHQAAWIYASRMDAGVSLKHELHTKGHAVYLFVVEGDVEVDETHLHSRDGIGIWDADSVELTAESYARILLIEIPMKRK